MNENIEYQLFLNSIGGIGCKTIRSLLPLFPGGAREILEDVKTDYKKTEMLLEKAGVMTPGQIRNLLEAGKQWNPEPFLRKLCEKKMKVVCLEDKEYPEKLRKIPDAPYLLYFYGELPCDAQPAVAIVGARMCSDYGRKMAADFAGGLARKGVSVISGLASGIDGISQQAALDAGGKSYGILGCGVDICYPASNRRLYEQLKYSGGILSEFAPGDKPLADHFPRRNRIISGLADIVLVVEAKERSGTSITVQLALEQGKEVFAMPGRNVDVLSRGCNKLIRDGAGIAMEISDILLSLSLMGYDVSDGCRRRRKTQMQTDMQVTNSGVSNEEPENTGVFNEEPASTGVDETRASICQILKQRSLMEQELYDRLQREKKIKADIQDVKCILTQLELEEKIVSRGGILQWKL